MQSKEEAKDDVGDDGSLERSLEICAPLTLHVVYLRNWQVI